MKKAIVKPLALDVKPDFIYYPAEQQGNYWHLAKVEPDVKGYYKTGLFVKGDEEAAKTYCVKEAAARGINEDQYDAAVGSSMFPANYFHQLTHALAHKAKAKKGGRRGVKRAN